MWYILIHEYSPLSNILGADLYIEHCFANYVLNVNLFLIWPLFLSIIETSAYISLLRRYRSCLEEILLMTLSYRFWQIRPRFNIILLWMKSILRILCWHWNLTLKLIARSLSNKYCTFLVSWRESNCIARSLSNKHYKCV